MCGSAGVGVEEITERVFVCSETEWCDAARSEAKLRGLVLWVCEMLAWSDG